MILADTSVWIDHLRTGDERLADLLDRGEVLSHPYVRGELALGGLRPGSPVLADLADLPQAVRAQDEEVMAMIATRGLSGRGIGWVDAHLLAAAALTPGSRLWTRDRRLGEVAEELGVAAP
jgi:predicted nucleic acid-binding protein